jgi:sec-independent protein translocase protein TatA
MFQTFAILDLSTPDLLIILAIILLLFGSKKLPELSKSLGQSARELKKGLSDVNDAHSELKKQVGVTAESANPISTEQDS